MPARRPPVTASVYALFAVLLPGAAAAQAPARSLAAAGTRPALAHLAPARPAPAPPAPAPPAPAPRCDTAPARARWADQFARRHAVMTVGAPAAAPRPATPAARRRAGAAPAGARVTKAPPGRARVSKDAPVARTACRTGGDAVGGLADLTGRTPGTAPSDALGDVFHSPLAGEAPLAGPTTASAGGDVIPSPVARRRGWSWPGLGWGAFVLGGIGAAGAAHQPGGPPTMAPPTGGPLSIPLAPLPPALPGGVVPLNVPDLPDVAPADSAATPGPTGRTPPGDTPPGGTPPGSGPAGPQIPTPFGPGTPGTPGTPADTPPTPTQRAVPPDVATTVVPEPAGAVLLAAGFAVAAGARWRRARRR